MSVPFVLDIVALVDISTLELSTLVGFVEVKCLSDTNAKDEANVARLALAGSTGYSKLPGLKNLSPIEAALCIESSPFIVHGLARLGFVFALVSPVPF